MPLRRFAVGYLVGLVLVAGAGGWWWREGSCGTAKVARDRAQLATLFSRWEDAVKVAGATPLIALAGPIGRLQDIHRDTERVEVSPCMAHARWLLARGMKLMVDNVTDEVAAKLQDRAAPTPPTDRFAELMGGYQKELRRVAACAPTCDLPLVGDDLDAPAPR